MIPPTGDDVHKLAAKVGFEIAPEELGDYEQLLAYVAESLEVFEETVRPMERHDPPQRDYTDIAEQRPPADDPYNAILRRVDVHGASEGVLAGLRVGLKDLISIAGVPMTIGSKLLGDFIPEEDATVTKRVLEAGGTIVATLNLENLAFSGSGETSAYGATLNPFDLTRTASGSSGGSAAALHYDGFDLTYGTDQGGSIRLPAAWCGVIGLKPTYGLVPYTGIAGLDNTIDFVGPLARTVDTTARGLVAVAGRDGLDPRQLVDPPEEDYLATLRSGPSSLSGVRIGVIDEGFSTEDTPGTAATNAATEAAIEELARLGATITRISLPEHVVGGSMFPVLVFCGATAQMRANGTGSGWHGKYDLPLSHAFGEGYRTRTDLLPPGVKLVNMVGTLLDDSYFGTYYAAAQNERPRIRAAFDAALRDHDVLLTPTATHYAHQAKPDASVYERVSRGWGMLSNCAPLNFTGHPAITLPMAEADGLPVGVQLIGRNFAEGQLLSIAQVVEREHGWRPERVGNGPS